LSSIKLAVPEGIGSAVWWSTCLPGFRQRALERFAHLTAHPAGFPLRQGGDDEQVLAPPSRPGRASTGCLPPVPDGLPTIGVPRLLHHIEDGCLPPVPDGLPTPSGCGRF